MFRLLLGLRAGALMTCVYARAFERKGRLQPWAQRLLHDCLCHNHDRQCSQLCDENVYSACITPTNHLALSSNVRTAETLAVLGGACDDYCWR